MPGITPQGWVTKTLGEIRDDLVAGFRSVFGQGVNVDPRSRNGQLIDIMAERLSDVWELGESLAVVFDPFSVGGVLLDNLAALTNTVRKAATKSVVSVVAIGTNGTTIPALRKLSVSGSGKQFENALAVAISNSPSWVALTPFAAGSIIASSGAIWRASTGGTTASTTPSGAGPFVDGGITWIRLGTGTAHGLGVWTCTENGPVNAYAGTLTVIDTPVAGWASAINPLDAAVGTNTETDVELRVRRQLEIAGIGTSSIDAIRAQILKVPGVTTCTVFENCTDVSVGGISPHAFEALVEGGDDAAIRAAIFKKSAGIETVGNVSGFVSDSAGGSHSIKFSRPTSVNIWVSVSLVKDPAVYPLDGDSLVKSAIINAGDARGLGFDVVRSRISGDIFRSVPGVLDVSTVLVNTVASPLLANNISMSVRQRADYDASRITVITTNGVA